MIVMLELFHKQKIILVTLLLIYKYQEILIKLLVNMFHLSV